ncbi:TPA: hypothetical protein ACWP3Y_000481 [Escherichia coli]
MDLPSLPSLSSLLSASSGNDDDFGEATIAAIRQTIQDSGVTRYRPLLIQQSPGITRRVYNNVAFKKYYCG